VSMFKKNYDHLPKDTYFGNYKDSVCGNPNYFLTYENGKSAARIQDHLRPKMLEEAAVLHYTYAKFSDLTSRRDHCDCKPTKEDVKRCFMLEFDRSIRIVIGLDPILNGFGTVSSSVPSSSAFFGSSLKKVTSRILSSSKVSSGSFKILAIDEDKQIDKDR
ncbi:hypothetical protein HN51_047491, partial [Arachis hypogaea]